MENLPVYAVVYDVFEGVAEVEREAAELFGGYGVGGVETGFEGVHFGFLSKAVEVVPGRIKIGTRISSLVSLISILKYMLMIMNSAVCYKITLRRIQI